jgi:hypothetical protein
MISTANDGITPTLDVLLIVYCFHQFQQHHNEIVLVHPKAKDLFSNDFKKAIFKSNTERY